MEKTAIVNGVGGFVGFKQAIHLLEKGYKVIASDLPNEEKRFGELLNRYDLMDLEKRFGARLGQKGALGLLGKRVIFVPADLTKPRGLKNLFQKAEEWLKRPVEKVFHIAAIFDFTARWNLLRNVNVKGTINLFEAAKESGAQKIVLYSSGAVYKASMSAQTENQALCPEILYAISKSMQEEIAQLYRKQGMKILIVRPAAIYGPNSVYGTFILLEMVAKGKMPFVIGKPHFASASAHVKDIVTAAEFLSSLPYKKANKRFFSDGLDDSGIFNINDDSGTTIEELLFEAAKLLRVSHNTKLIHIHIPFWLIKPLLLWQEYLAKKRGVRPKIERDSLRFLKEPFLMNNAKLKSAGYKFVYPEIKENLKSLLGHYVEEGVI